MVGVLLGDMSTLNDARAPDGQPQSMARDAAPSRYRFVRWLAANAGSAIPRSMAPIVFGLAAAARGDVNAGALMVTVMTLTQVIGAVPITALGRRFEATAYARALTAFRTVAFLGLVVALTLEAPMWVLVVSAGLAGLVNGALFGVMRAILSDLIEANKLPRALGITATTIELIFVSAPIVAATVGGRSVVAAVLIMAVCSAAPIVLLPRTGAIRLPPTLRTDRVRMPAGTMTWFLAQTSTAACVASIEVGAVVLAIRQGLEPGAALLFVVPACIASVLGGVLVSAWNRRLSKPLVVAMLCVTALGMLLMVDDRWIGVVIGGTVLVGFLLAPLAVSFSLLLEDLLPLERRAEGFALLRTCQAIGMIIASSLIASGSLEVAIVASAVLALFAAVVVGRSRSQR